MLNYKEVFGRNMDGVGRQRFDTEGSIVFLIFLSSQYTLVLISTDFDISYR